MFEVTSECSRKYIHCGLFVAAALSLLPWTGLIAEMPGPPAVIGVCLMALLLLAGYGLLKQWRISRLLAIISSALSTALLGIISAGALREGAESPFSDLFLIVGLPLLLNSICLLVAVPTFVRNFMRWIKAVCQCDTKCVTLNSCLV